MKFWKPSEWLVSSEIGNAGNRVLAILQLSPTLSLFVNGLEYAVNPFFMLICILALRNIFHYLFTSWETPTYIYRTVLSYVAWDEVASGL